MHLHAPQLRFPDILSLVAKDTNDSVGLPTFRDKTHPNSCPAKIKSIEASHVT